MELYSSRFFTTVGINIFNFHNLWHIFDDFNKPIYLIDLNYIDEFLLEKFSQPAIHFVKQLWILATETLHLHSQKVNQVFGSGILDWDFDGSFAKSFQVHNISCGFEYGDFVIFKHIENSGIHIYSQAWIISTKSVNKCLEVTNRYSKLLLKSIVIIFNFSASYTQINWFFNTSSSEPNQESFKNSLNISIWNTILTIDISSFKLSE